MITRYLDPYPKGQCAQLDILWPENSPDLGTLGPKYIYFGYMDP